jgi:hypothetical protein
MSEWAKTEGYQIQQQARKRISFTKTDCGIAAYRSSSSTDLIKLRDEMIKSGEIDIGVEFRPIEDTVRTHLHDNTLSTRNSKNPARVISLEKIRRRHLELMHSKHLLREDDFYKMNAAQMNEYMCSRDSEYCSA